MSEGGSPADTNPLADPNPHRFLIVAVALVLVLAVAHSFSLRDDRAVAAARAFYASKPRYLIREGSAVDQSLATHLPTHQPTNEMAKKEPQPVGRDVYVHIYVHIDV